MSRQEDPKDVAKWEKTKHVVDFDRTWRANNLNINSMPSTPAYRRWLEFAALPDDNWVKRAVNKLINDGMEMNEAYEYVHSGSYAKVLDVQE